MSPVISDSKSACKIFHNSQSHLTSPQPSSPPRTCTCTHIRTHMHTHMRAHARILNPSLGVFLELPASASLTQVMKKKKLFSVPPTTQFLTPSFPVVLHSNLICWYFQIWLLQYLRNSGGCCSSTVCFTLEQSWEIGVRCELEQGVLPSAQSSVSKSELW